MAAALSAKTFSAIDLCVLCQTLTDGKAKPGILPCLGCQQLFCYQHMSQHRQDLTDQLDTIVVNARNNLCEVVSKLETNCDHYIVKQMEEIDQWELNTSDIIKQMAENARQKLHQMTLTECDSLKARFALLTAELNEKRESDSYFENTIEMLKHKFDQLKDDIENMDFKIDVNSELQTMQLINIKKKPSGSDSFIDHLLLNQKPSRSIHVRNNGEMCTTNGNLLAFEHNGGREIDLYNTVNGSLTTMTRSDDWASDLCYSTYLQSFLYLIRRRRPERCDLYRWNITHNNEPDNTIGKWTKTRHSLAIARVM